MTKNTVFQKPIINIITPTKKPSNTPKNLPR